MRAMNTNRFSNYTLAVLIATCSVVGCRESSQSSSQPDVMVAYEALASAVAACGEEMAACSQGAEGDMDALQTCRDAFSSCRQTAGGPAAGALADAIRACTQAAGECASNAGGEPASDCHEELVACLGANRPALPDHDASSHEERDAPVGACIDTLLACVEQDGGARACAQAVRACVIAAVPAPDGVIPEDPGSAASEHDAGMPDDVASDPVTPDAGMAGDPPAASCMEMLEACLSAGGSRQSCGQQLRECGR
jgi:hypothetical protein